MNVASSNFPVKDGHPRFTLVHSKPNLSLKPINLSLKRNLSLKPNISTENLKPNAVTLKHNISTETLKPNVS